LSGKSIFEKTALFFSACFALVGLVGIIYVIKMGALPSKHLMGHSREYEQGWVIFFSLLLGIPCLLAFLGGLAHWILWFVGTRKKTGTSPQKR